MWGILLSLVYSLFLTWLAWFICAFFLLSFYFCLIIPTSGTTIYNTQKIGRYYCQDWQESLQALWTHMTMEDFTEHHIGISSVWTHLIMEYFTEHHIGISSVWTHLIMEYFTEHHTLIRDIGISSVLARLATVSITLSPT